MSEAIMASQISTIKTFSEVEATHVQEVVRQAHAELQHLLRQRAEIVRKIGTVKQTLTGLAKLFGDNALNAELLDLVERKPDSRQSGFTNLCRKCLMTANRALSSREVREWMMKEAPLVLKRHKDPTASITTVLNRLVAYGEAKALTLDNGHRAWQWLSDLDSGEPQNQRFSATTVATASPSRDVA
jgi:chorismate mutase